MVVGCNDGYHKERKKGQEKSEMVLHRELWAVHLDQVAFEGAQAMCWLLGNRSSLGRELGA